MELQAQSQSNRKEDHGVTIKECKLRSMVWQQAHGQEQEKHRGQGKKKKNSSNFSSSTHVTTETSLGSVRWWIGCIVGFSHFYWESGDQEFPVKLCLFIHSAFSFWHAKWYARDPQLLLITERHAHKHTHTHFWWGAHSPCSYLVFVCLPNRLLVWNPSDRGVSSWGQAWPAEGFWPHILALRTALLCVSGDSDVLIEVDDILA